jgi:hypoxanthine phosphoribosyltransferase
MTTTDILTLHKQAQGYLQYASIYKTQQEVQNAIKEMAIKISNDYHEKFPLFLNVLGHGAFLTTYLLSNIQIDAQLDTIQINQIESQLGTNLRIVPSINILNRDIILLDELLDDGKTMQCIMQSCMEWGARSVTSVVLCSKENEAKVMQATYTVFHTPKHVYLFGCGMNVYGFWAHLPDIRLLNSQ